MSDSKIKLLTPEQAAEYLSVGEYRISVGTLANWRSEGKGPKPTKIGRHVFYTAESLDAYIRRKTGFNTDAA